MTAVTARLIPVIVLNYPAFAARFGSDEASINFAANEYAERLQVHGITGKQFMAGIAALKAQAATANYHPNPEQFVQLCKQASIEAMNIPAFDAVLSEIILRKGAERHNAQWQFSHPMIHVICNRKGALMFELTGIEFEKAIRNEYDHWVKRLQNGEQLPELQLAIGYDQRPEMPAELRAVPKTAMALRVEAMRAEAAARKTNC